ncbi:Ig-like domain-containing protein [Lentisalinibacter salinarum]|uniref:Ig-like domain-containing protein n=1 Tax=Lentisalinibacter salinarum TaxID=2992239 RepID=UPI00386F52CB
MKKLLCKTAERLHESRHEPTRRRPLAIAFALLLLVPGFAVSETLMMPDREGLVGEDIVVWGATDQAGANYTIDCGNGTTQNGTVTDGSYIPFVCNYGAEASYTATLTVGAESDTAEIAVFDPALIDDRTERGVRINMAIEDGLRWLWVNQENRAANFPAGTTTEWAGGTWRNPYTSFVVLAFENQGYRLSNDNTPPTGIYEKYIVRRGINRILTNLAEIQLSPQAAGDPCVGVPADGDECVGLFERRHDTFHQNYSTGVAVLALAGSGALNRTNTEASSIYTSFIDGKSYGEILQRMANALVFGQIEPERTGRGGWYYNFNAFSSDGSTVGWVLLGLLDAEAAGITIPDFVKTEHAFAADASLNVDGSYDYQSDGNPNSNNSVGIEKGGVGLQSLFFAGLNATASGVSRSDVETYLSDRWNGGPTALFSSSWRCRLGSPANFDYNHACAYSMYNAFKGLRLVGTQTLPGVNRPAGPGAIPENDWYADYVDWLIANQTNPTSPTGGNWGTMAFSAIDNSPAANVAIAELILSPVALVLPDPVKFATVGLTPFTATNPVGTDHTVTATAESANDSPIPGTTIEFEVISGPNAGASGSAVTNGDGEASFTYTSDGTPGTDNIQAFIGNLESNIVEKIWEEEGGLRCDIDEDGDVDRIDIGLITAARNQPASGPDDPRDNDGSGTIDVNDARQCVLLCTLPRCATP